MTLPPHGWSCPECTGQAKYDMQLSGRIRSCREKLMAGALLPKQQDGFSQLVFDLSCVCSWDEFDLNIQALITLCVKQLESNVLPIILPFHRFLSARPHPPFFLQNDFAPLLYS